MIKILIRKIIPPSHRDFIKFRVIKISFYLKFCRILKSLIVTKKKLVRCLINIKDLEKKISFFFLIFDYQRLYGSFKNINRARKFYLRLLTKSKLEKNIDKIISAKIELGDFDNIDNIDSIKDVNQKLLVNFINNKQNQNFNIINKNFYKLINNKSIAVVGPAKSFIHNGKEIDEFDYVVRINVLPSNKTELTLDKPETGMRTDIIYYNDSMVINWEKLIMNPKNIAWNVFKNEKNYEKYIETTGKETCSWQSGLNFKTGGGANMILNILFDLLKYNPKEIKIFNADFWYNGFNYMKSYQDHIKMNNDQRLFVKELRQHDAFFNYQIVKKILNNKKVKIDKVGLEPMNVGIEAYAKKLDKFFENDTY